MLFVGAPKDLSPERIQRWLDDLPAGDIRDAYRAAFQDPVVVASMRALLRSRLLLDETAEPR